MLFRSVLPSLVPVMTKEKHVEKDSISQTVESDSRKCPTLLVESVRHYGLHYGLVYVVERVGIVVGHAQGAITLIGTVLVDVGGTRGAGVDGIHQLLVSG